MSKEKIMKPMSVARDEFINDLTKLINGSMLPPFVIEDILKDMYGKICRISRQQLENESKQYREALAKSSATSEPKIE